ncbi:MAG: DNA topoisomerase IB [Thermomicrobiales bacterium]
MMTTSALDTDAIELPADAAAHAGLRHTSLDRPGFTRERSGSGWAYRDREGKIIHDERVLERIRAIVIPPAWTDIWICPDPRGHIQAVGFDLRGRRQYRYHPKWRAYRDETKFDRLAMFGELLPELRERVESDLLRSGLPRQKVLAIIVKLLDTALIRIGNRAYERTNGSFGLTTLRNRHVQVSGATIRFTFRGKSGTLHDLELQDRRLANAIKRMRDIPGYHVFQYLDSDGQRHEISSDDVNGYLRELTGSSFTAKDFRTWAGTVRFVEAIDQEPDSTQSPERQVVATVKKVAAALGNTPAVCRASYIHPAVIEAFLDGSSLSDARRRVHRRGRAGDSRRTESELIVLDLLKHPAS